LFPGATGLDKGLSIVLILAILAALGILGYVIATPKVGERFTEFYILGLEGEAEGYPKELVVGEEAKVIVGIVNREHEDMSYWVEVIVDGITNQEIGPVAVVDQEKWEQEVSFTPVKVGENQKVEFLLFRQGQSEVYQMLYIWVDVARGR